MEMAVNLLLKVLICVATFATGFGCTTAFAVYYDQSGRLTNSQSIDATTGGIIGNSSNARPGQCVMYSMLITNGSNPRQVQTGLVRCDGTPLAGTCTGGYTFAERYNGLDYICVQGNNFNNGTRYNAIVSRNTATEMSGVIGGASAAQSGFPASDAIAAFAWGEASGGGACPSGSPSGSFRDWQRIISGGSWGSVANGPTVYHSGNMPGAACWTVGALSGGNFDVN
jgi:hypothetical protein